MKPVFDPTGAARLVAEMREDDARMTRAPWSTPSGTRLRGAVSATIGGAERQVASAAGQAPQFDDAADVNRALGDNAAGIARLRNNAKPIADQLEAAIAEVDWLRRDRDLGNWLLGQAAPEQARLSAEVARLRAVAEDVSAPNACTCRRCDTGLWCGDGKRAVFTRESSVCTLCGVQGWKHSTVPPCPSEAAR